MTAAIGHIAVVDDDDLFRESIGANLEDAGFDVTSYGDGASFLAATESPPAPDVVLLDWKMPELNGIDVLKALRARGSRTPVVFLTVLGQQIYEEAALAGGAVDFIEKSRSFSIVLRRIKMILDGVKSSAVDAAGKTADVKTVGPLELNYRSQRAQWRGRPIALTLTEFRIVARLVANEGEDVSYRELYDQVHGRNFMAGDGEQGVRANVRALIKRIRAKFREVDEDFERIANYPSFGYRWES
ncbi:MAG: response regulator transcription factor [Parvularculaceae bacterium]